MLLSSLCSESTLRRTETDTGKSAVEVKGSRRASACQFFAQVANVQGVQSLQNSCTETKLQCLLTIKPLPLSWDSLSRQQAVCHWLCNLLPGDRDSLLCCKIGNLQLIGVLLWYKPRVSRAALTMPSQVDPFFEHCFAVMYWLQQYQSSAASSLQGSLNFRFKNYLPNASPSLQQRICCPQ